MYSGGQVQGEGQKRLWFLWKRSKSLKVTSYHSSVAVEKPVNHLSCRKALMAISHERGD
jgi:hypothetical protein